MTLADWLTESRDRFRDKPAKEAVKRMATEFWLGGVRRVGRSLPVRGEFVFDRDWDALIVLDACRPDALEQVASEYKWLPAQIPTITSRGTYSRDWMQENFVGKYEAEKRTTAHVSWNPYTDFELNESEWAVLEEVWRDVWDDELGAVPPRAVTERAVATTREHEPERLLVHYMQPHAPFRSLDGVERLSHDQIGDPSMQHTTVWDLIRERELTKEQAWEAYLDNLRWALDDVELLLENLSAERAVLTADHGECFGEWALYGHPKGIPAPQQKRVPWVEVEASDNNTLHAEMPTQLGSKETASESSDTVNSRLSALGYI